MEDVSKAIGNLGEVEHSLQHCVGGEELFDNLVEPPLRILIELVFYTHGGEREEIRERWLDGEIQSN